MKVIVIGCTHAGTASVLNIARLHKDAEITIYEKNDNVSFLSCGIALYVGGEITDVDGLFYSSPEELKGLGAEVNMRHEVLNIDTDKKEVEVKNLVTDEIFTDPYDKLVMTTGSWPIVPPIPGIDLENILLSKNFYHANTVIERAKHVKNIVVVGAGYIGVELVEAFKKNGKNVTLIDAMPRILSKYLDKEYTDVAEKTFEREGVKIALNEKVSKFEGIDRKVNKVVTDKNEYEAELVIMCIGFKPNTGLLKDKVDMLGNGAIVVNEYMQTTNPDIYAAGDSCAVRYNPTGEMRYIPLATNAVRMGTLVGRNIKEPTTKYMGTQGTSAIKIFENNIASTGLTEEMAKAAGLDIKAVTVKDSYRPEFMPTHEEATLKVVYEKDSKRLIGAQICSDKDLTQIINTMSVMIQNKMTIDQLAFMDFYFLPHYSKPWNLLNQAGLQAE
jgi:NADPH-dependent 2,4-dienoyl-CoA reductase/sulfur reductase-like enzyme